MKVEENASASSGSPDWVFFKGYFFSPVSVSALAFAFIAGLSCWASTTSNEWWRGYLQGLSTTCVGIASTVWLVSYWSERKTFQLLARLRAPVERAILHSVSRFIKQGPLLLPTVEAPSSSQWYQFIWIQNMLDRVRGQCDVIAPGVSDTELQEAMERFRLREDEWSESLRNLQNLIEMEEPSDKRASAFQVLKKRNGELIESGVALRDLLSLRHKQPNVSLGLDDE